MDGVFQHDTPILIFVAVKKKQLSSNMLQRLLRHRCLFLDLFI